jgi:hypothetical protein
VLHIPPRGSPSTANRSLMQVPAVSSQQLHSAAYQGLVPVRPIPTSMEVAPRAQLLRPQPVE